MQLGKLHFDKFANFEFMEHLHCFWTGLSRKFFFILFSLNNTQIDRESEEGRGRRTKRGGEKGEEGKPKHYNTKTCGITSYKTHSRRLGQEENLHKRTGHKVC